MEAEQLEKLTVDHGFSMGWIYFKIRTYAPLTLEAMQRQQESAGYPIMGYGFYAPALTELADGTYRASWRCQASCE